jgi:folate-binding protein YgfZ
MSDPRPLEDLQAAAGALFAEARGQRVARHFGDPEGEYRAAVEGVALLETAPTVPVVISGRQPAEMIQGVMTNTVPDPLAAAEPEVAGGTAAYAAILTPKGRMLSDLWIGWRGSDPETGLLMELPIGGAEGTLAHLARFIPPRLAKVEDASGELASMTVAGPGAPELLERVALGLRVEREALAAMAEGDVLAVGAHPAAGIRVRRMGDLATPAWRLTADQSAIRGAWKALHAAGAVPAGFGVAETLRVEAGTPSFGADMTENTIPVEAGIHGRAIDYEKGCYTGQEVIVRIRDRGQVNRHLRGLRFGEGPAVAPGTELFAPGEERSRGVVTSEALSPRAGQSLGLGYVRREIEVPGVLRVGSPDGPVVEVRELTGAGWFD